MTGSLKSVLRTLRLRPAAPPEEHAHLKRLPHRRGPANIARQMGLRTASIGLTALYGLYRADPALWRFTAKHYHPKLERIARLNAWLICQHAALDVPAYQDYLARHDFNFTWWDINNYPVTSKDSYVRAYDESTRCWAGKIHVKGTVIDESAGSSGTPFNWIRSAEELYTVHKNVAGYLTMLFGTKDLLCINAFSMGAWATGTNTGQAMAKVAMVKNTGPDLDKILDTMRHFGPDFTYLIAAYPPFLKHLADRIDAAGLDFDNFRLNGFVGGEAMTEGLRDYLQRRFHRVYSGYGASDLTIGMGGETDLSITLRKGLTTHPELRRRLLGEGETRTPMIFQYNPLETYMETTDDDELVVTINSSSVMSPRLRYNIGDEAKLVAFDEIVAIADDFPQLAAKMKWAHAAQRMKLPFLLIFGRADSTISYMGANIYPLDVQDGLYKNLEVARFIEAFQLELTEIGDLEQRPTLHIQLRNPAVHPGAAMDQAGRQQLAETCAAGVHEHLATISRDVAESIQEDPTAAELLVKVHDYGTGPFAESMGKIKNVYLTPRQER